VAWDLYTTLDIVTMQAKVAEALELLMGTSAYTSAAHTDGIIPYVPIYSRTFYDAWDENLLGVVNAKLAATWNGWTGSNMYWRPGSERYSDLPIFTPGTKTMMIFTQGEDYQYPANPLWASSAVTNDQMFHIYDGLIGLNPYNLKDTDGNLDLTRDPSPTTTPGYHVETWTVTDGPAAGNPGMKVTYYLNSTARMYHDGHVWDAYDLVFGWEYTCANKVPRAWSTMQYFHHAEVEDANTVTAYMTTTGITLPYGLDTWGAFTPEHIWGCTASRGGRAKPGCVVANRRDAWNAQLSWINSGAVPGTAGQKPATDADATDESGLCMCAIDPAGQSAGGKLTCIHLSGCVLDDHATGENEILDYDPAAYAWGTTEYPWLTEMVGNGPWVYYNIDAATGIGNLVAFDESTQAVTGSGIHYYASVNELHNTMTEYFWELGDVDLNGEIRVVYDLAIQGANFFVPVPPAPSRADINRDGIVDIIDMSYGGLNFGEERELLP
jgi:hypothetical protein